MSVKGTDTRIIQARRYRMRFYDLTILGLHKQSPASMNDTFAPQKRGSSGSSGMNPFAGSFYRYQFHPLVIEILIIGPGGIGSTSHTGNNPIGMIPSLFFLHLHLQFLRNDRLEPGYHIRKRMRTYHGTNDIMRFHWMVDPVPDGFVGSVLQRPAATGRGPDFRSKHLHTKNIGLLTLNVDFAHIYDALHSHQ